MITLVVLFLTCSKLIMSNTILPSHETYDSVTGVSECVIKVNSQNIDYRLTFIISIDNVKPLETFEEKLINAIARKDIPVAIVNKEIQINDTINIISGNVIIIKHFKQCQDLTSFIYQIEGGVKYLSVVSKEMQNDQCYIKLARSVAEYDITFLIPNNHREYYYLTYTAEVNETTCNYKAASDVKHRHTGSCRHIGKVNLYPDKNPKNMKKCPFPVGMATFHPHSEVEGKQFRKTLDPLKHNDIRGSDFEIIKIIADQMNASLEIFFILKDETNPFLIMDFMRLVENGTLEACAGGLYRLYGDIVSYSGPYAFETAHWLYKSERPGKTWQNFVGKFNYMYVFLIFYLSHCIAWYTISVFDKKVVSLSDTLMYSWGALIEMRSLENAFTLKQRILTTVFMIMSMHLSAYMGIQLYSFLTIYEPPEILRTSNDIMTSGRKPFMNATGKLFISDPTYLKFASTAHECQNFSECGKMALLYNGVSIATDGSFVSFQAETAVNDEARVLRTMEHIVAGHHEMAIHSNSFIVHRFQQTVQRLNEAGICKKLHTEALGLTIAQRANIARKNIMANSYSCQLGCPITLKQTAGVFYLMILGYLLSMCVFIVEVILGRPNVLL